MALFIPTGGAGRLTSPSPPRIVTYPFSIGVWVQAPAVPVNQAVVWMLDNGLSIPNADYFALIANTTDGFFALRLNSVTPASTSTLNMNVFSTPGIGPGWNFFLVRCISSTSRFVSVLPPDGLHDAGAGSTDVTPLGITNLTIGNASPGGHPWENAGIAEFWYTENDVYGEAVTVDDGFIRQLAYGGPFSIPSVASSVLEYMSLHCGAIGTADNGRDVYSTIGQQEWTASGTIVTGPHPSLPNWYRRPGKFIPPLGVV